MEYLLRIFYKVKSLSNFWNVYLGSTIIIVLMFIFLLLAGCENMKQTIGISTNPFSSKMEEKTKLNYKITFGKIRPKEDDDD